MALKELVKDLEYFLFKKPDKWYCTRFLTMVMRAIGHQIGIDEMDNVLKYLILSYRHQKRVVKIDRQRKRKLYRGTVT